MWETWKGECGLVLKEKPFIKLHCVLRKDIFKLLYFFSLKAHEIVKLPIIKDPSKYLKCKIYFTFFSPRCYNVIKIWRSGKSLESL